MLFDPQNPVIKCCADGMEQEALTGKEAAAVFFSKAWELAATDTEYCVAAHYMARVQETPDAKLRWDIIALEYAQGSNDENIKSLLPSLYLNTGKGYEDTYNYDLAAVHYEQAQCHTSFLAEDGYGNMIRSGIRQGLERLQKHQGK